MWSSARYHVSLRRTLRRWLHRSIKLRPGRLGTRFLCCLCLSQVLRCSRRATSSAKRISESSWGSYPITLRALVMLQKVRALLETP